MQWQDVTDKSVLIRRRVYRHRIDSPKTHHSVRTVPLSSSMQADLAEWRTFRLTSNEADWVFPSEHGNSPVSPTNVWLRNIKPTLQTLGIIGVNFQTLRRTASTLLRQTGADPKLIADTLGHRVDVNLACYTKTFESEQHAAIERLSAAVQTLVTSRQQLN